MALKLCSVAGCQKPVKVRGLLCSMHYERQRLGKPLGLPVGIPRKLKVCIEAGCGEPIVKGQRCVRHSQQHHRSTPAYRTKRNARRRAGYATNPDPVRRANRMWLERHPESKSTPAVRRWRAKNPKRATEHNRASKKRRRQRHPDVVRAEWRRWAVGKENRLNDQRINRYGRASENVVGLYGSRCWWPGCTFASSERYLFHLDHVGGGGRDERKKIRDPMKCLRWRAASFLLYVCGVLEEPVHQLLCIKHHQEKTRAEMRGRRKSIGG